MATYVLVAGARLGGWAWQPVTDQLREHGHDVHPVTLTELGERSHLATPRSISTPISDEERDGVGPTDTEAESPLGVGVSMTRRGEDVQKQEDEPGREHAGAKGASDCPAGVSDTRSSTGIDDQETQGGPTMPAGDQGG